ncbi:hypothetical protein [Siminovitchia sp. 179-K 8D1 HS]|uniref:hypothetical protein n=1 Tax=Siminovitchia sp. 179-K 8D1 HS TaxID=3142385 RepID=UPI0039A0DFC4
MEYINHVTITTGHSRKTYPNEVDKELYFILKRIYKDCFKNNGTEIMENYRIKGTISEIGILMTIFNNEDLPVLTTAISNSDHDGVLWEMLHSNTMMPIVTDSKKRIGLPYIADRLEVGAISSIDAMKWTGDFSRCMGWIALAPEKVR